MATVRVNAELLLGCTVYDVDGRPVGRIEEFVCGIHDGRHSVLEIHLGTGAAIERILGFVRQLPFLGTLPVRRLYRVRWDAIDLSDISGPGCAFVVMS